MKRLTDPRLAMPPGEWREVTLKERKRLQEIPVPPVTDLYYRLASIEDILGDEYELDDLKNAMWCMETMKMAFAEETDAIERLRELWFADQEGRCVVLDGKSRDKELIRKLVRLFYWLEDCIKKKNFSPFRIVAGAPENNYPFISAFQRIENEYEFEIHLAGKDEEAEAALRREQDE